MQVIGLCRFSYPAIGGFQIEHDSIEARKAYLWSEDRLEERFRLFEAITLPALKRQSDDDFDLMLLIGDDFPARHRARLEALVEGMLQVRLIALPPKRNRETMKELFNAHRKDPTAPCLQFRLDDDDAVAITFVADLRNAADDCKGLLKHNRTVAFDWSRGYYAEAGPGGLKVTEALYRPFDSAALGMYVKGGAGISIMNLNHKRLAQTMPAVTFGKEPMYIRTHNGFNDSRQKPVKEFEKAPMTEEVAADIATRFAVTDAHVRKVFAP